MLHSLDLLLYLSDGVFPFLQVMYKNQDLPIEKSESVEIYKSLLVCYYKVFLMLYLISKLSYHRGYIQYLKRVIDFFSFRKSSGIIIVL